MFTRKQKAYEMIPPFQTALLEHIKRAAHQAGHVYGQTLIREPLFQLLKGAGGKIIYRFCNRIGHLYQQSQPVVKNKQKVAARDVHAL